MADMYSDQRRWTAEGFGYDAETFTPADADMPINVKAVICSEDCTLDFKNAAGDVRTGFPARGGVPLPFIPARITAVSSGDVWLVF